MFSSVPMLLTEAAVASILKVSLSTTRRWRRDGTGPAFFHLGATMRYTSAALAEFIDRHTPSAVSA